MRSTDALKDAVFSYLAVSVYISPSRAHTNTSKKRGKDSFEKCEVKIYPRVTPIRVFLPITRKGDCTVYDRAVANLFEKNPTRVNAHGRIFRA